MKMLYTILTSDTDCDGTTFQAHRQIANTSTEALDLFRERTRYGYDIDRAMPEVEFLTSDSYLELDEWHKDYYLTEGYTSLGAHWNPWVYDDTIGTPLDTRYDDDVYYDAGNEVYLGV